MYYSLGVSKLNNVAGELASFSFPLVRLWSRGATRVGGWPVKPANDVSTWDIHQIFFTIWSIHQKKNSPNDKFTNSTIEQLVNSTIFYSTGANSTRVSSPIQIVCLKAPPGGLRSGALAPWSQGVWGLAPILGLLSFRPIQTTSSGGCNNFLKPLTTFIFWRIGPLQQR